MKERKYPASLFVAGMILNLVKRWYILCLSIILFVIRIFVPALPIPIPVAILILWLILAFVEQLTLKKVALESEDEVFDKIFIAKGTNSWKSNAIDMVNEKISEYLDLDIDRSNIILENEVNKHIPFLQNAEIEALTQEEQENFKLEWFDRFIPIDKQQKAIDIYCLDKHGYLWHAFSGGILEHFEGEDAKAAFDNAVKRDAVLLANWDDLLSCRMKNIADITAENLDTLDDIILTDSNFLWTYSKTHEPDCGPYFYSIP